MLDFNAPEFLVVAVIALLVIGPKDLPKLLRVVGKWVGRARGVARQFRSGIDTMIRESELADMEKQWAAENERIMREHPPTPPPALPMPMAQVEDDGEPVMVEQPVILPDPQPYDPEPAAEPAAAKPVRKRKAPTTGDTLEAPKPAPKPRKPRAKAAS